MYAEGRGVKQDDEEAVKWYRKAAEQGYAEAQYNLGILYANGRGVRQDIVLAYMWLDLAASQGVKDAQLWRAVLGLEMTRRQIAEAQRLSREWKPAE